MSSLTIKDMTDDESNQNFNFLFDNMSTNITNKIIALSVSNEEDRPNTLGWGGTSTHHYTVQSAYNMISKNSKSMEGNLKVHWNWKGPHMIQTFM